MESTENAIKKIHPHPLAFSGFYISGILFIFLGFFFLPLLAIMGLLVFVVGEISRRAETFYILETGVERSYDFLVTSKKFVEYEKIQNIEVSQSFIENIFGLGSIKFDTAGTDQVELRFYAVRAPYSVEKIIRDKMAAK